MMGDGFPEGEGKVVSQSQNQLRPSPFASPILKLEIISILQIPAQHHYPPICNRK